MFEIKDRCLTHYIGGSGARIVLPKEIDSIGSHAFADCLTLEEVHIPGNVTTISEGAFSGCLNLKRVILEEGVKRIRKDCFRDCSSLETVLLPESLTSIQNDAFAGCSALQSIRLPWGLTAIAAGAFRSCTGLTSVTIPAQVKLILSEAFAGCSGLRTVVFESAQTKLNGDSFAECFALDSACMFDIAGRIDKPLKVAVHAKSDGYGRRFTTFAEHRFTFDGVECRSLESVLQSFRFADCNEQIQICGLEPRQARLEGKQKDWTADRTLYWQGISYDRFSPEYQNLLDRMFQQLFEQDAVFRLDCLLLRKGEITLPKWTRNPRMTVLCADEYRLRLEALSCMEPGQVLHTDLKVKDEEPEIIHTDYSRKAVVMGGSFNPPTIAHLKLMQAAMTHLGAETGIFVPSSDAYVRRKMTKQNLAAEVLPGENRIRMLREMCTAIDRLTVSTVEFDPNRDRRAQTFETLEAIAQQNPETELYFLAGSDKLDVIPYWHRATELLSRFRLLLVGRMEEDPAQKISANPFLRQFSVSFSYMEAPAGIGEISSTAVRRLLRQGDSGAETMLHPAVWKELTDMKWLQDNAIRSFREEYDYLSNFYPAPVEYKGLWYLNNEAAFQAQKCMTEEEKQPFTQLEPSKAKRMGRQVPLRLDWEEVKVEIMAEIVRAKFTQNPWLASRLVATGDREIIEGNTWGDTCWGVDTRTGKGENHLGKILMAVREQLREENN